MLKAHRQHRHAFKATVRTCSGKAKDEKARPNSLRCLPFRWANAGPWRCRTSWIKEGENDEEKENDETIADLDERGEKDGAQR